MQKKEPRFNGEVSERSHNSMSHIHGKDTSIEIILRKALWKKGYRYRKNFKNLPGRPDIALTKYKIAIFCDSEFFHGKDWETEKYKIKSNREFWWPKIERNITRDIIVNQVLENAGWKVIRFWSKSMRKDINACVETIMHILLEEKDKKINMKQLKQKQL